MCAADTLNVNVRFQPLEGGTTTIDEHDWRGRAITLRFSDWVDKHERPCLPTGEAIRDMAEVEAEGRYDISQPRQISRGKVQFFVDGDDAGKLKVELLELAEEASAPLPVCIHVLAAASVEVVEL